ncbi:MAG TPA: response regulator [Kofleriaceae bacterium]|nr:response regulator [Kofleriaceae bacterium]
MTTTGHILIVDDDRDFVTVYDEIFKGQGLVVTAAHSASEATHALESQGAGIDVVLLDQKLQGHGGPDSGLDLIARVRQLAPFAKAIIVTGYASPDAIERAFRFGVYDYLVKNGAFEALLRAKVSNAIEVTRELRLASLSHAAVVRELHDLWAMARTEPDRNRKGKLLEEVVKRLFRATPGFERVDTRLSNDSEEIDIVVENRCAEPPWRGDGSQYLLGECKNWSKKCGSPEFRGFHEKLTTKFGRARTGFFIAPGGFTDEFHTARARHGGDAVLVIPVDAPDLELWIASEDRLGVLGELHKRAVFDLKG